MAESQPPRIDDAFRIEQLTIACQSARMLLKYFISKYPAEADDAGNQMVMETILITERRYGSVDV